MGPDDSVRTRGVRFVSATTLDEEFLALQPEASYLKIELGAVCRVHGVVRVVETPVNVLDPHPKGLQVVHLLSADSTVGQ